MDKLRRQAEIVKLIATEPWLHNAESLAAFFGTSEQTIQRDLKELIAKDCAFAQRSGYYFLRESGWLELTPIKDTVLRQVDILQLLYRTRRALSLTEIEKGLEYDEGELSEKTIERAVKGLVQKGLLIGEGHKFRLNSAQILLPLQLEDKDVSLFFEALAVAKVLTPMGELMKALEAKLKLVLKAKPEERAAVYVHGRAPIQDVHRSQYCRFLEKAARLKRKVKILYRKGEESAKEIILDPLGIVYYWALDKWYLAAQTDKSPKTNMIKTYAIDNILMVESLEEAFTPPVGFILKDWYKYAWGIYREGKITKVKIRFYDYFTTLQRVKEELRDRETCRFTEDERGLIMEDEVDGLEELAVWLRGFGPGAEVLEPPELREKVKEEWIRLNELYGRGELYKSDRTC